MNGNAIIYASALAFSAVTVLAVLREWLSGEPDESGGFNPAVDVRDGVLDALDLEIAEPPLEQFAVSA